MGVVIKKLPHPYKLIHKITSKKRDEAFLWWVSSENKFFLEFLGHFSHNFSTISLSFFLFFSHFSLIILKNEGVLLGDEGNGVTPS